MGDESVLPAVLACGFLYLNNSFPVVASLVFITFEHLLSYPSRSQGNVKVCSSRKSLHISLTDKRSSRQRFIRNKPCCAGKAIRLLTSVIGEDWVALKLGGYILSDKGLQGSIGAGSMLRPGRDPQRLRVRLPEQQAMPEVPDLYRLLGEAERLSGRIIEQPWFLMDTFQTYSLTVEFEPTQKSPIWTLCQALDDNYRLIWTCRDTDLYLLHDILSMFMAQSQPKTPGERAASRTQSYVSAAPPPEPKVSLTDKLAAFAQGVEQSASLSEHSQDSAFEDEASPVCEQIEPQGDAKAKQDSSSREAIRSAAATTSVSDGVSATPEEAGIGSGNVQAKADEFPVAEAVSLEAACSESSLTDAYDDSSSLTSEEAVHLESEHERPSFFDNIGPSELQELKEKPNLLLGHLLVESGAIPVGLLDAALKLQEMVRTESLTPSQSIDAMRRAYHRTAADEKAVHIADASDSSEGKLVSELLYEAGIVSREDIEAATKLKVKRGGELDILRSSGKVDKLLQESAFSCLKLMLGGRIRHEQAIIALNYCYRSRVELREAFVDLGWSFPYSYH